MVEDLVVLVGVHLGAEVAHAVHRGVAAVKETPVVVRPGEGGGLRPLDLVLVVLDAVGSHLQQLPAGRGGGARVTPPARAREDRKNREDHAHGYVDGKELGASPSR